MKRVRVLLLLVVLPFAIAYPSESQACDVADTLRNQAKDSLIADSSLCDVCQPEPLPWPRNITSGIDSLLKSDMFETSMVGMEVYDLTDDSVIYCYNERQRMRPASTMKMIVAVAALDRLGGSFRFNTSLYYTGSVDDGTLLGDVYCEGGMDPLFNGDDMNAFVESLRKAGIDSISGNVYADLSMKDTLRRGEGWCWDDDNPVLTPLLVSGKDNFMKRFTSKLNEAGISLAGDTLEGITPDSAYHICTRFHTIDQVLMPMMKKSDNLFAEALFYQLGADTGKKRVSAGEARNVVNRLINKVGLSARDYYIADGSGLSLYNYVSPHLEVALLRYAYANRNIYAHLFSSMPLAGADGTLAKRMREGYAQYNVRAKTGTVEGVSALAGYATAANGHKLCFAIINMGIRRAAIGRRFQDRVCEILCKP